MLRVDTSLLFHCLLQGNLIYIHFEHPVAISVVRLTNYSKTPTRGVQHLQLFLDDILLADVLLKPAPAAPASLPSTSASIDLSAVPDFSQSLLFSEDPQMIQKERSHLHEDLQDPISFVNDGKKMLPVHASKSTSHTALPAVLNPEIRPSTSVTTTSSSQQAGGSSVMSALERIAKPK